MNIYTHRSWWKLALLSAAILIALLSLLYTQDLVRSLKAEERKKVEIWAEATRQLLTAPDTAGYLVFLSSIIEDNSTVPVILTDGSDSILTSKNFDPEKEKDAKYLASRLARMKSKSKPILIEFGDGTIQRIYYQDSIILRKLIFYPYIQLSVIILFIIVAYFAFSSSRKAEQNQVWVGMSKETAHQLGTPTSSLAGWIEILRIKQPDNSITTELARDVARLEKVTERFSKIGSRPELTDELIVNVISQTIEYLKSRTSSKIKFVIDPGSNEQLKVRLNSALFSWVIENLCKNAIDATDGEGTISIMLGSSKEKVFIDVTDNGRGIPKSAYREIFRPGFTTKTRGWGLGLSLAKRIIEDYHSGRIFVRYSEPGKETCIRIIMRRSES